MRHSEPLVDLLHLEQDPASRRLFTTHCGQPVILLTGRLTLSSVEKLIESALSKVLPIYDSLASMHKHLVVSVHRQPVISTTVR